MSQLASGLSKSRFFRLLAVTVFCSLSGKGHAESCASSCSRCVPAETSWVNGDACDKCSGATGWPCETDCECADDIWDCRFAVSADFGVTTNEECREFCDDADRSKFEEKDSGCKFVKYRPVQSGGSPILMSDCLSQWIHGYSDDGAYGKTNGRVEVGRLIEDVPSVSECQQKCQEDSTCVSFVYRFKGEGNLAAGLCLLKTKDQIVNALAISLEGLGGTEWQAIPAEDPRYTWCNMGLGFRCNGGGYVCAECEDVRCVYKSELHVAGPKFCGVAEPICEWRPWETATTTTESTTSAEVAS